MRTLLLTLTTCLLVLPAHAKYRGGSGTAQDPYQIATAADLIALGETPSDCDKHFILTADIDLDPKLPGRKVFDKAVIAPDLPTLFAGVFDGKGHVIRHLTIRGNAYLGLFGRLGLGAQAKDLGVVDVNIVSWGDDVGGLVGNNQGNVAQCYSTGVVNGGDSGQCWRVGGLVGSNGNPWNAGAGNATQCYSTCTVSGSYDVGGLVGQNSARVTSCYSTGAVSAGDDVGGLVGDSSGGTVTRCYSTGQVSSTWSAVPWGVGGLVGSPYPERVTKSIWDMETSGQSESGGGLGLTTGEMMDPFMLGLNGFANDPNWVLDAGHDYPRLAWQGTPGRMIPEPNLVWLEGGGTSANPYQVDTGAQLTMLRRAGALWDKHFVLRTDIDLDPRLPNGEVFRQAVIPVFRGAFDGRGHKISHLTIQGKHDLGSFGLFGILAPGASVHDLGVVDVNITGSGNSSESITGSVYCVGGLAGTNDGTVTHCYSTGAVRVRDYGSVGGLVGLNDGTVTQCYSTGAVSGKDLVGGLVGDNIGPVTQCYSTGAVSGRYCVAGLLGYNEATVAQCYSTGAVSGTGVGGLVGESYEDSVVGGFWDTQTSGQTKSGVGAGKTTAEMQTAKTFLDAGWDFVGETKNGTEDIWWILEGKDYPRLWWELEMKP